MRERKKRIVFIGIVLLAIVILMATPIILPRMRPLKAVYLEDENGKTISEKDLNNGDVLNIYGDGAMADSSPGKYDGITKIKRMENANQNYIEEYGHFLEEY